MTQDQKKPPSRPQQDQKREKDSAGKNVDTTQDELDPSSELGLKSPIKESERSYERLKPEDGTPRPLGKESRNDQ